MPGISSTVRDIVYQAAKKYFAAAGASVIEVSIPMHRQGPAIWTAATRPSMSGYLCHGSPSGQLAFLPPHAQIKWPPSQETYNTLTALNPAVVNIMLSEKLARSSSVKTGLEAKTRRMVFALRAAYDAALEHVDILVTPCASSVAMAHPNSLDSNGEKAMILDRLGVAVGVTGNTCPFNVTGHPALSVPCGFSAAESHPDVSLPVGMQIVARCWNDEKLLEAGTLFEWGREISKGVEDSNK